MRILLVLDKQEVREKLAFSLESTYGAIVTEAAGSAQAVQALAKGGEPVNLVVFDVHKDPMKDLPALQAATGTIPWVLCTPSSLLESLPDLDPATPVVARADRERFPEKLIRVIDDLVEREVVENRKAEHRYIRIKTSLLLSVCPLKGDIFIRLNESKFVKLFREGDVFDMSDMEKYTVKKGIEYLYIPIEQTKEFADKYRADLERLLNVPTAIPVESALKQGAVVHETVQSLANRLGFTKEVQELTKTQVKLSMKAMGRSPGLADLLRRLKAEEGKYIASHSDRTAFIACAIAAQMKWGSEATFYKLSLAAFMHDVPLSNQDLAAVQSIKDLEGDPSKFTPDEIKAYKMHPIKAAENVKQFNEIPPDVDTIILQHHERPDGSGFPRGLNHSYIAPLSAIFIVSHELVNFMIPGRAPASEQNAKGFVKAYREKYKMGNFKKTMQAIEEGLVV